MQAREIENDGEGLASAQAPGDPVWFELARRLNRLTALVRVQAHAVGVPALATLLMQGLVL